MSILKTSRSRGRLLYRTGQHHHASFGATSRGPTGAGRVRIVTPGKPQSTTQRSTSFAPSSPFAWPPRCLAAAMSKSNQLGGGGGGGGRPAKTNRRREDSSEMARLISGSATVSDRQREQDERVAARARAPLRIDQLRKLQNLTSAAVKRALLMESVDAAAREMFAMWPRKRHFDARLHDSSLVYDILHEEDLKRTAALAATARRLDDEFRPTKIPRRTTRNDSRAVASLLGSPGRASEGIVWYPRHRALQADARAGDTFLTPAATADDSVETHRRRQRRLSSYPNYQHVSDNVFRPDVLARAVLRNKSKLLSSAGRRAVLTTTTTTTNAAAAKSVPDVVHKLKSATAAPQVVPAQAAAPAAEPPAVSKASNETYTAEAAPTPSSGGRKRRRSADRDHHDDDRPNTGKSKAPPQCTHHHLLSSSKRQRVGVGGDATTSNGTQQQTTEGGGGRVGCTSSNSTFTIDPAAHQHVDNSRRARPPKSHRGSSTPHRGSSHHHHHHQRSSRNGLATRRRGL